MKQKTQMLSNGLVSDDGARLGMYDKSRQLKKLNTTRAKLASQLKRRKLELHENEVEIPLIEKELRRLEDEIELITDNGRIIVSEHALLRYLARYHQLDLDKISEEIAQLPREKLVIRGVTIVTILEDGERNDTFAAPPKVSNVGGTVAAPGLEDKK